MSEKCLRNIFEILEIVKLSFWKKICGDLIKIFKKFKRKIEKIAYNFEYIFEKILGANFLKIQDFCLFSCTPYLQNFKLNSTGDLADHNLKVLTTLFPYPGTGLS